MLEHKIELGHLYEVESSDGKIWVRASAPSSLMPGYMICESFIGGTMELVPVTAFIGPVEKPELLALATRISALGEREDWWD